MRMINITGLMFSNNLFINAQCILSTNKFHAKQFSRNVIVIVFFAYLVFTNELEQGTNQNIPSISHMYKYFKTPITH